MSLISEAMAAPLLATGDGKKKQPNRTQRNCIAHQFWRWSNRTQTQSSLEKLSKVIAGVGGQKMPNYAELSDMLPLYLIECKQAELYCVSFSPLNVIRFHIQFWQPT